MVVGITWHDTLNLNNKSFVILAWVCAWQRDAVLARVLVLLPCLDGNVGQRGAEGSASCER